MDLQKTVWIIVVLSSASAATATVSGPWWSDYAQGSYCATPGEVRCSSDCSEVQLCMGHTDGEYYPETMETCSLGNGMKCSAVQKTCVPADQSECHSAGDFKCNGAGSFPDPYDCKKYHFCLEKDAIAITGSCSSVDAAYNPLTADCTLTTSDRVCTEGPVESCTDSLQVGVVPENQAIYYVCKPSESGFEPDMYRCPHGEIFDVNLFSCEKSSAVQLATPSVPLPPSDSPAVTSPPSRSPPPSPTQPTHLITSSDVKCTTPGGVVGDPEDCRSCYYCTGQTWQKVHCSDGYHYDPQEGKCTYGPCPA